jgi:energy-coupling factor transporter transmembrane protein EcfT
MIPARPESPRLSPVTRLFLLAAGISAVLASRSMAALAAEAAVVAILMLLGEQERRVRSLRLMGPMVGLVFVLGGVFFDLATAANLALRLFSLLGIAAVCFASLRPEEVGAALAGLKVPPAPAFMLTAGLRYVPLIEKKIRSIRDAQQARGIDLRPRLKNIGNCWPSAFSSPTSWRSPWRRAGSPESLEHRDARRGCGPWTGRSWLRRWPR